MFHFENRSHADSYAFAGWLLFSVSKSSSWDRTNWQNAVRKALYHLRTKAQRLAHGIAGRKLPLLFQFLEDTILTKLQL